MEFVRLLAMGVSLQLTGLGDAEGASGDCDADEVTDAVLVRFFLSDLTRSSSVDSVIREPKEYEYKKHKYFR